MKKLILGLSTICALVISANAQSLSSLKHSNSLEDTIFKVSIGAMRFKNLKKTDIFTDVRYVFNASNYLSSIYHIDTADLKLSSDYQDIGLDSFLVDKKSGSLYLGIGGGVGYLRHKSTVQGNHCKPALENQCNFIPTHTQMQKAPYITLKGFVSTLINEAVTLNMEANYKYSIDRADFKNGYEIDTGFGFKSGFTLGVKYQTLHFNGADTQKDISYEIGYLFRF